MSDYRQFKLSNNQEIICNVLEWDNEETSSIIINNVLEISAHDNFRENMRVIGFRTWMCYPGPLNKVLSINSNHIVAETIPAGGLLENYLKTVTAIGAREDISEIAFGPGGVNEEHLREMLNDIMQDDSDSISQILNSTDSDNNVIPFKPKGTLH